MSGNIRRQLGPVRKRLGDRIKEATEYGKAYNEVKSIRARLASNVIYHEELTAKLEGITAKDGADKEIIESELEKCITTNIDVREILQVLDDRLDSMKQSMKASKTSSVDLLSKMKLQIELKNLLLDTKLKKAKLDSLKKTVTYKVNVKLPEIDLPIFSGNIMEWPTFWNVFSITIHNNTDLPKVGKFKYLMSCLVGGAKDTISGFKITESEYDQAVKLLKDRFEDMEFVIHSHYEKLTNIPKSSNETNQLRQTVNSIETHLRSLASLGENTETKHLVALVKFKLPYEFNLKLEELRDVGIEWNLKTLRTAVNKLLLARERSNENYKSYRDNDNAQEDDYLEYSGEGLSSKDVKLNCVYCSMNHWSDECQKYRNIQQRKGQITERCFVCLSTNHLFRDCKSERSCLYCKRKNSHHSSLCPQKFGVSWAAATPYDESSKEYDIVEIGEDILIEGFILISAEHSG